MEGRSASNIFNVPRKKDINNVPAIFHTRVVAWLGFINWQEMVLFAVPLVKSINFVSLPTP